MLSATYTISDIKSRLGNGYSFYGYSDSSPFETDLGLICDDVYRLYFLPRIGASMYTRISAKDRIGFTVLETYLYWAEVYATCFEFLRDISAQKDQLQDSGSESLRVEGYTYSNASGRGGSTKGDTSIMKYYSKMYRYFANAGINISSIQRTCSIFEGANRQDDIILNVGGVITGVEDVDIIWGGGSSR